MTLIISGGVKTSVGSAIAEFEDYYPIWRRTRAVIAGEKAVKDHDDNIDGVNFGNLLIPFSPSMSVAQFRWYLSEAELPGLTSQYSKILLGGLLRKPPQIELPKEIPEDALDWITNHFTEDNRAMVSFLDEAVFEELSTSRCWISVDYPVVDNFESLSVEERGSLSPYPIVWRAEDVINWQTSYDCAASKPKLSRVVFRYVERDYEKSPWHPDYVPMVADHYLNDDGIYCVDYYRRVGDTSVEVNNGTVTVSLLGKGDWYGEADWQPVGETVVPKIAGQPLRQLPIWPLNGDSDIRPPLLTPLVDKEISLYNKMSRRNHLLYGAATYTPVLSSDMRDEDFQAIVEAGLGSWLKIGKDDSIDVLRTPVEALSDLDRAITQTATEMANLGTRILTPDVAESGIALQIRNAPQTAQLGTLNQRISGSMREIIAMMLYWKYGEPVNVADIKFNLSDDFSSNSISQDTASLLAEWYQYRLIPRSVWINACKKLEIIPSDYDDKEGQQEMAKDSTLMESQPAIEEGA